MILLSKICLATATFSLSPPLFAWVFAYLDPTSYLVSILSSAAYRDALYSLPLLIKLLEPPNGVSENIITQSERWHSLEADDC